jgi:hypothetical protein
MTRVRVEDGHSTRTLASREVVEIRRGLSGVEISATWRATAILSKPAPGSKPAPKIQTGAPIDQQLVRCKLAEILKRRTIPVRSLDEWLKDKAAERAVSGIQVVDVGRDRHVRAFGGGGRGARISRD